MAPPVITTPTDGATDIATEFTPAGTCDANAEGVRTRASWQAGNSGWVTCTKVGTTWTADGPLTLPGGETITFDVRSKLLAPISNNPWVLPANTGHRVTSLHSFPAANDGANANVIDTAFLSANSGAAWRAADEGGVPVIEGALIPRGLRIQTQLILRDCVVYSGTRSQTAGWGYPNTITDCPVIMVNAANVIVEHSTIYGTGFDDDICSRGLWVAGANLTVRYCDISGVRGAIQQFNGTIFEYNYCHDFAFGWQSNRAGGTQAGNPDEVTHNNAINNLGYTNCITRYNWIDCRYGRVSNLQPGDANYDKRLTPIFRTTVYNNGSEPGEVVVNDPIDGFTFANYLQNGDSDGYEVYDNFVSHAGRVMLAQTGEDDATPTAAEVFSRNVFQFDRLDDFQGVASTVQSSGYTLNGSCNMRVLNSQASAFASNFFSDNSHVITGCTLPSLPVEEIAQPDDWRGMIPRGSSYYPYGGNFSADGWWFPPVYPPEPAPLGAGTRKTASNTAELDAIMTGGNLTPGDVVVLADATYLTNAWCYNGANSGIVGNGTAAEPIVFYAENQHGAVFNRTIGSHLIHTDEFNGAHMEWWGIEGQETGTSTNGEFHADGSHFKWCNLQGDTNSPIVRHRDCDDGGVWFSTILGTAGNTTSAFNEGHYVGWGSDDTGFQDNIVTIGCTIIECLGGAVDVKPGTSNYLGEFNVVDAVDKNGAINLNDGWGSNTFASAATRTATASPSNVIWRNNIQRVQSNSATSEGDGVRIGGPVTLENNIIIPHDTGDGNRHGIFVFDAGGVDFTIHADSNRIWFTDTAGVNTNNGATVTWTGSNNRVRGALEVLSGSVAVAGDFVGGLTGDFVDVIAMGRLGGLGTGMKMVGATNGYEVV